jgi:hypothetical protein
MTRGTELVHYDATRRELDACHAVDEIKTFRNKAIALKTYARIANDHQAERKLAEIRIRAKRKCGEALRDSAKASRGPDESGRGSQRSPRATRGAKRPGHRSARPTDAPKTLRALGISKRRCHIVERRTREFCVPNIFKRPRLPRATCS